MLALARPGSTSLDPPLVPSIRPCLPVTHAGFSVSLVRPLVGHRSDRRVRFALMEFRHRARHRTQLKCGVGKAPLDDGRARVLCARTPKQAEHQVVPCARCCHIKKPDRFGLVHSSFASLCTGKIGQFATRSGANGQSARSAIGNDLDAVEPGAATAAQFTEQHNRVLEPLGAVDGLNVDGILVGFGWAGFRIAHVGLLESLWIEGLQSRKARRVSTVLVDAWARDTT